MADRTHNGDAFRILNIVDEYTRECLVSRVERRLSHEDVLAELARLFCTRRLPAYIRSDNGPEFIAERVRNWLSHLRVGPLFIEKGSPWYRRIVQRQAARRGAGRGDLLHVEGGPSSD